MKIELHKIPVRDVVAGYVDNEEDGCRGYGGKLNIRPAFQREFVYSGSQRDNVIKTINKGFPLNVMYWVRNSDGNFEMLDGQQRTISICQYVEGDFTLEDHVSFSNLTKREREQILNYELMIYICEGDDKEKLDWFKTINIAGEKLTAQEMRNAIFACEWLNDAKIYFSKPNCPAYVLYGKYLNGYAIRQDYLETALKWICDRDKLEHLELYMDKKKANNTKDASELWEYFDNVFKWVRQTFPKFRSKLMKGQPWGIFYNKYGANTYNADELESEISRLLKDFDVTNQRGIYEYLLGGGENERLLNIRQFDERIKETVYERQDGICVKCGNHFDIDEMHADHITPWSLGGKTVAENCQLLCADCNRRKRDI